MKAGIVLALLVAATAGCIEASPGLPDLGPAPAFEVDLIEGGTTSLSHARGQVVILNLWATWCQPCQRELPLIQSVADGHQADALRVLAISMDEGDDAEARVGQYVADAGLTFEVGLDEGGARWVSTFHGHGSLGTPPETYLIGRDGTIHAFWQGAFDPHEPGAASLIDQALAG